MEHNEDEPRTFEERATQTVANDDSWLVRGMVFSIRLFLVLFIAFARAIVIVAGDKIPDNLFEQVSPMALGNIPSSSSQSFTNTFGSSEAPPSTTTHYPEASRSIPSIRGYYIVFIGREVGFTTSSTLMTSLVTGVPNNYSQRYNTFDEALQAYIEAALHGNVRRVRTLIQPSGHVEFIYEYMSLSAGIRNLDAPHLPSQPLTRATSSPEPQPRASCSTEIGTDSLDDATPSSTSTVTSAESNGLVMPVGWSVVGTREAGADTVIISSTSSLSAHDSESAGGSSAFTVIFLDSDEELSNSSVLANSVTSAHTVTSTHSAHSSDIYYTDKAYDRAFAAYIEEEDNSVANIEPAVVVQIE